MTKPDQNRVNLGPAKIKTDDAIYDAVDQGIVGTTTVVPAQVEPGFVPIGPIGDLITPPVLAPVTGYPIYAVAINFNDNFTTYPFLPVGTPWCLANLSGIGSFTNSLVVNSGIQGPNSFIQSLEFVNLDNPSQRTTYAGKGKKVPSDYIVRDGVLTHGWSYFVGGEWVEDDVTITVGGSTQTITGATLNTNIAGGIDDYTHRYFYLGVFGLGVGHVYARMAHTGPLALEVVGSAPIGFNAGANPQLTVQCVESGVLWIASVLTNDEFAFAMDVATGDCTSIYSIGLTPSYDGSWFGLLSGAAAFLGEQRTVASTLVNDLHILDLDGSITTQASFITRPTTEGALNQFVAIPGTETMIATDSSGGTVYQIGTAGYQTIGGFPNKVVYLRISTPNPGALRFWGSNATDTNVALYEFVL